MSSLKECTTVQLKEILRKFGLSATGNKAELVARVLHADPEEKRWRDAMGGAQTEEAGASLTLDNSLDDTDRLEQAGNANMRQHEAFKQISLRLERKDYHNRYAERFGFDRRKARKENQNIVGRDLRCYNCGMVGHTSRDCKQRRREWGSCFE
ncbi:uncharacterized protein LOC120357448 [Solenopsis invicta]|uniref:uncharacterized protein LOC120357448 n=1 Tax=Solenopsis invicta TaxID=13686 RepID=UPI00193D27D7|nr:uncharacterized protein LOC120357448 [Solenopsis invicta]